MKYIISLIVLLNTFISNQNTNITNINDNTKIVSLNGTISEILVELGLEKNIVGVDATSTYPKSLSSKTQVGHRKNISIEGIASLNPTIVLAMENDLKPEAIKQLSSANIKVLTFKQDFSTEGSKNLIKEVAKSLNLENKAKIIVDNLDKDLQVANNYTQKISNKPKVLFIYARGLGTLLVAGKNTQVDKMIELAGGINAANSFNNFKPLTPEGLISANPDVILLFDSGYKSLGGEQGLLKIQGITQTNAGKNKKFIEMDGQTLTGFGPRLGKAIQELSKKLN